MSSRLGLAIFTLAAGFVGLSVHASSGHSPLAFAGLLIMGPGWFIALPILAAMNAGASTKGTLQDDLLPALALYASLLFFLGWMLPVILKRFTNPAKTLFVGWILVGGLACAITLIIRR